jgi:DHA2 family multidrug resistance protein
VTSKPASHGTTYPGERRDVTESGLRLVLIVVAVMLAALMQTLDSTITNVALPNIQGNLGASQDEGTWVVTAYTVAAIIVIPLTPWLQGRFGRKAYFLTSIIGFTIASMVCGSSNSLFELVAARAVQGAFGGGLLATSQSILRDSFPPKRLGLSQGIFAIGAVMGPALGPPLGGILVDNASWNWAFDINIVPGTISAILLFMLLRDPEAKRKLPIDAIGLSLLAVTLGTLQYVLTEGEQNYWLQDPAIASITVICVVTAVGFVWWELFGTQTPVVDLRILTNRSVAAGTLLSIAIGIASLGSSYTLPQLTQGPLGFTPTLSGLLFLVRAAPIMLATLPLVFLASKIDTRVLVGFGFFVVAISGVLQAYTTTPQSSFETFMLPLALSGVGIVTLYIPLSIAVLGSTTPAQGPKAGAFLNLAVQLGGSIGVAGLSVFVHQRQSFHSTILSAATTLSNLNLHRFTGSLAQVGALINLQSTVLSYADATFLISAVAILSIPLVLLIKKPKRSNQPAELAE